MRTVVQSLGALIALSFAAESCQTSPGQYEPAGDVIVTVRLADSCKPMDFYRILIDDDFLISFPDTLGSLSFNVTKGRHEITVRHLRPDPVNFWRWSVTIDAIADTVLVVPCHDV